MDAQDGSEVTRAASDGLARLSSSCVESLNELVLSQAEPSLAKVTAALRPELVETMFLRFLLVVCRSSFSKAIYFWMSYRADIFSAFLNLSRIDPNG
jgi:hypothetical protein